jgi:hypothetical protein
LAAVDRHFSALYRENIGKQGGSRYAFVMQIISSFVSRLRWYQLLLIIGLTTLAAIIILPYFFGGSDCKEATKVVGSHIHTVMTECPSLFVRFYTLCFFHS